MRRRTYSLAFALFLIALLTVQSVQADLVLSQHNPDYSPWNIIIGGKDEDTCKPCHAYWDNLTYNDVSGLVINTPSRVLDNCVGCHSSSWVTNPNLPSLVDSSVHGSLSKKCLSCHTIYHSGHARTRLETINNVEYITCKLGKHDIAGDPNDPSGSYLALDTMAFMRIYAANSTVIPTYKPIFTQSTTETTSYNSISYNLVKGSIISGSTSDLSADDSTYMTIQAGALGNGTEVTIQPPNSDSYINEDKPSNNYGNDNNLRVSSRNGRVKRSLVQFDISSLPPGVSIISATLELYLFSGAGNGRTLDVYKVTSSWTENGVDWGNQPTVAASSTDSQTVPSSNGWMSWTVTSDVSAWVSGENNYGFRISDSAEGSGDFEERFYSSESGSSSLRPRLIVSYVDTVTGYSVVVEFTGTSNDGDFVQLVWSIDSAITVSSVPVTVQLYDYNSGSYPSLGSGYMSYTSSATPDTDETRSETIQANPDDFKDSTGNWKIRVNATLSSITQFNLKVDWIEYKPTYYASVEDLLRLLYQSVTREPFGETDMHIYNAYLDPWNKNPSLITSTERNKICFNCHFITTNPAEAAVRSDNSGRKYIPLPENVFTDIANVHSIESLKDNNLNSEDISIEKRSSDPQITLTILFVTVAIIILILVSIRK